jgi:Skp family chaperone for outer membrane proteins
MKRFFFLLVLAVASLTTASAQPAANQPTYNVTIGADGKAVVTETVSNSLSTTSTEINQELGEIDRQMAALAERRRLLAGLLPLVQRAEEEAKAAKATPSPPPSGGN